MEWFEPFRLGRILVGFGGFLCALVQSFCLGLVDFGGLWCVPMSCGVPGGFWWIPVGSGWCWLVLANSGGFWRILAGASEFLFVLVGYG
jgi:hypothetical protein